MANVAVEKITESGQTSPSLVHKLETMAERIRQRAYHLFEHRSGSGSEIDDWLQAEHDLFPSPESELIEKDGKYEIRIAVPGFKASEIIVTALPDAVIVSAESCHNHEEKDANVYLCEFGGKSLYRRLELPESINVDKATANLDDGIVRITAQKAESVALVGKAAA